MNPPDIVTVGASGAIMALLSATFVCSFHDEAGGVARRMRYLSLRLIIPSLLPSLAGVGAVLVFDGQKEDLFEVLGQWDRDLTRASRKACWSS